MHDHQNIVRTIRTRTKSKMSGAFSSGGRLTVKRFSFLTPCAVLTLLAAFATSQAAHHFPTPPPSLDPESQDHPKNSPSHRVDLSQMQTEADDLARTAQTIPSDVASVRKGTLPKDAIEKLKQIEKLSKRLRIE
jgi:hypothetical protein